MKKWQRKRGRKKGRKEGRKTGLRKEKCEGKQRRTEGHKSNKRKRWKEERIKNNEKKRKDANGKSGGGMGRNGGKFIGKNSEMKARNKRDGGGELDRELRKGKTR